MKHAWLFLILLAAVAACESVLGIRPTEPVRDAAVTPDLPVASENPWSCVGQVDLVEASSVPIPINLTVSSIAHASVPTGLSVTVCRPLSCTDPVAGPLGAEDGGVVNLSLPADFMGYLTIQSDANLPAIVQIIRPVSKMTAVIKGTSLPSVVLVDAQTVAGVALGLSRRLDPSRGILLVQTLDCLGNSGVGVSFRLQEADAHAKDFYFLNRIPTLTQGGTDLSGGAGIVDVPTGFVAVQAIEAATGVVLSSFSVEIQAGWVTYATVEPQ